MAKGRKTGGRQKGTPNKTTETLKEIVERIGIDPFEVLVRLAAEDWQGLGYPARTRTTFTAAGIEVEEFVISPELRGKCAADACKYIHAQRKAIEQTIDPALMDKLKEFEQKSDSELMAIVNTTPLN